MMIPISARKAQTISLGEVVDINPQSIGQSNPFESIEYVDISSVGSGVLSETKKYSLQDAPSRAKRLVANGDTILSTVRPNRRSFLFIKKPKENLVVSTGFAVLRPSKKIDPRFLYYTVTNQTFTDFLTVNAKGAAYPAVDTATIFNASISLPDIQTQREIASILSAYDDLIENNTRRIKILEEMAQSLYREWFINFRFPGHEKVKMVDSPLGKIPAQWKIAPVDELFEITGGGTPSKKVDVFWHEGEINWFVPSDLTSAKSVFIEESSNKITEEGLRKSSARLFPAYSVMMTSRATIGVVAISTTEACTNQGFITCIPNDHVPLFFLYYWLLTNKEKFLNLASGATFKEINKTVFRQIDFLLPEKTLVLDFESKIRCVANQILNLQRQNENLHQTRDFLLPKLISWKSIDIQNV